METMIKRFDARLVILLSKTSVPTACRCVSRPTCCG